MNRSRKKTLILSIVFSSFGPFVLLWALFLNTSTTQLADFLRRTVELSVLILAFWMFLRLEKQPSRKCYYQKIMYRTSGGVLILSALFLFVVLVINLVNPVAPTGNVILGLSVAALGVVFNAYFSIRYKGFNLDKPNAVMDTQGKLYQAKTVVDVNVVITLGSMLVFTNPTVLYAIDSVGTSVIVVYLMIRGLTMIKTPKTKH